MESFTRELDWDGCFNARDLGGLRTVDGQTTRFRALVRADLLDHLTPAGRGALRDYGVRTVIDLRNDSERHAVPEIPGATTVHVPLDDDADRELWEWIWAEELDGTPLYYRPFLDRKPERCAAAVAAIAGRARRRRLPLRRRP